MIGLSSRNELRKRIHRRIRKKLRGSSERPRLNVYRSLNHIYAQLINDESGTTLVSASSQDKGLGTAPTKGGNVAVAKLVGRVIAERACAQGVKKIVFDRGGYLYHGRVKALADAAREHGLEF
ncbi:MAG: 50S ribosomal protein L18 [Acidobacteria bacterium]|nr:50S ribosomal protein L18 [Acidobacteriota bacterium]MBI3657633.1 50S ribosomal protein L18 [Acidobacteriota bacterium]